MSSLRVAQSRVSCVVTWARLLPARLRPKARISVSRTHSFARPRPPHLSRKFVHGFASGLTPSNISTF